MGDSGTQYKLRCALMGHSMDVRGVTSGTLASGELYVASASRDKTSRLWVPSDEGTFQVFQINEGHTKYASCILALPISTAHPNGLILTGGNDHSILGFEIGQPKPIFRLVGHHGNVCTLDYSMDGLLVSGSWDCTAKVWRGQENIETLTGHEAAVWSVAFVPGPIRRILTGSADRKIKLWVNGAMAKTFTGHTDCVRSLVTLDHTRFLSSSNDASILMWNVETGETLNTFYGHTNYIYSMAKFENSDNFVTVGEDRTLRVWSEMDCKQVIHLPALSVWSVSVMQNGDIITGSSDGVIRIFTCDPARVAAPDVVAAFEQEVASTTIAAQQELGGMKISDLPGPEVLLREGRKDGDTTMVREGTQVACYSWSGSTRRWTKIGDVVGASGATQNTSGKQLYEGKEYDYVFSIELDDKSTLKLPYNITEDPWFVAQKFIDKHSLPQGHLDQVANFITKNTQGMQLGVTTAGYEDPFTGGNRYVPGSAGSFQSNGSGGGVDPFTGSGAYTTSQSAASSAKSTADTSNSNTDINAAHFPISQHLRFPQPPNYQALTVKLNQFVEKLATLDGTSVKPEDINTLISVGQEAQWSEEKARTLQACLNKWPEDCLFPIFDLLRIGVMVEAVAVGANKAVDLCGGFAERFMKNNSGINQMLILRLLCNVFDVLDESLLKHRNELVQYVLNNISKDKRNQVAAATLFLNYTITLTANPEYHPDHKNDVKMSRNVLLHAETLMALASLIDVLDDPEAIYRMLVGFGNLITCGADTKDLFVSLSGDKTIEGYKNNGPTPKIKFCSLHILTYLATSAKPPSPQPHSSQSMDH